MNCIILYTRNTVNTAVDDMVICSSLRLPCSCKNVEVCGDSFILLPILTIRDRRSSNMLALLHA